MNELSREDQIQLTTEMIADIWGRYPNLRLGQLIEISMESDLSSDLPLLYINDINLLSALEDFDEAQQRIEDDGFKDSN